MRVHDEANETVRQREEAILAEIPLAEYDTVVGDTILGRPIYYVLDGEEPRAVGRNEWIEADLFDERNPDNMAATRKRRIAETTLHDGRWVSTVFLGIDHGFSGPPILFETLLFETRGGEADDIHCYRYVTYREAQEGHAALVKQLDPDYLQR